jgi:uncharacterized membrane protein
MTELWLRHLAAFPTAANLAPMLRWWAFWLVLGVVFWPLARRIAPASLDGGFALGKLLALAAFAWSGWLAASLGVASPAHGTAIGAAAVGVAAVAALWRRPAPLRGTVIAAAVAGEALFAVCFTVWCAIRARTPALASTEKFMDFGFVHSILHASALPPPDPWFAGAPINYYYFGHFVVAALVRATGVAPAVGYNLMVATLFAAALVTSALLVGSALAQAGVRRRGAAAGGLAAGALLALGGNAHPFWVGVLQRWRAGLPIAADYRHPLATRFVGVDPPGPDQVITEFPAYSFVVADLHAHVLNLPFALAFLFAALAVAGDARPAWRVPATWVAAALLGLFWMTNAWAAPIYAVVLGVVLALRRPPALRAAAEVAATLAGVAVVAVGIALPYTLHFEPFGRGVAWSTDRTSLHDLAILWAAPLAALAVLGSALLSARRAAIPDRVMLGFAACAFGLVAIPELFYLVDGMQPPHRRANTVFKLGYEAFVLLALVTGYSVARTLALLHGARRAIAAAVLTAVCLPLAAYLPFALRDEAQSPVVQQVPTLDGLALMRHRNPEDAALVDWLDAHARGGGYVLEGEGRSFSYAGRIAVMTGIPTVLAWTQHEWLWRPRSDLQQRLRDVTQVYEGGDPAAALALLRRYGVRWVVLGELERLRYPALRADVIEAIGEVVVRAGASRIVRVPE